jgi:myo-inositol-1(or 4)-monophosphatase
MKDDKDFQKIKTALESAREILKKYTSGKIKSTLKEGGDPVTKADIELDGAIKGILLADGEGWLSEETVDNPDRLDKSRVWIVDPLDGTREFVEGLPEWCVSIGLARDGEMIAGGILNPAADQLFIATEDTPLTLNGEKVCPNDKDSLKGAKILASRTETRRGEWKDFEGADFEVTPCGSVAYKLACVAAGLADATFTLVPKNEWDIAAGTFLLESAGGKTIRKDGTRQSFNNRKTLLPGFVGSTEKLFDSLTDLLNIRRKNSLTG